MESIVIGKGDKSYTYRLFSSKEEFESAFIDNIPEVVHWRDAENDFDWIQTDFGAITQAIRVRWYGKYKKYKYVTTMCGTVIDTPGGVLTNKVRKTRADMWRVGSYFEKPKRQSTVENRLLRKKIRWFALLIIGGYTPHSAFSVTYGNDLDELNPARSPEHEKKLIKRMMESKWGSIRMIKAVKDAASALNLNHEYVLKQYMALIEKEDVTEKTKMESLERLGNILGTFGNEFSGNPLIGGELPASPGGLLMASEDELTRPSE